MTLSVLFEDNHLLAVAKPAGVLAQGDASGVDSLVEMAKAYRKLRERKPGNVYIGLTHRLDRATSGVILLAKTSKAASRLSEQFRRRAVTKRYLAVTEARGKAPGKLGEWVQWDDRLTKDHASNRAHVEATLASVSDDVDDDPNKTSRPAATRVRPLASTTTLILWELEPTTGRSHQLRVQLASRGFPIVGDRRYGAKERFPGGIALHAAELIVDHPVTRERMSFQAPLPGGWRRFPFRWPAGEAPLGDD